MNGWMDGCSITAFEKARAKKQRSGAGKWNVE